VKSDIERARTTLASVRRLVNEDPVFSINRAYYAAFYAARAAVRKQGSTPKIHSGLAREVGRLLVPAGILPPEQARFYSALQTKRELFDYGEDAEPTATEAAHIADESEAFIEALALYRESE
jgi:uncharacterized protein (UPF0332 family)